MIPPEIDLVRLGYVLKSRIDDEGMTYAEVRALTGVPTTQISHAIHGKRICAAHTYVLAAVFDIDFEWLLPAATTEMLRRVRAHREDRKTERNQGVSVGVSRGTAEA